MTTIVPGHRMAAAVRCGTTTTTGAARTSSGPAVVQDGRRAAGPGQQTERGEQITTGSGPRYLGLAVDRKVAGDERDL